MLDGPLIFRILFLDTENSCCSQIAEGWCHHLSGRYIEVKSAGTVATDLHPKAVATMKEIGIDISKQRSKQLTPEMLGWADFLITLSQQVDEQCPSLPRGLQKMCWTLFNPKKMTENSEEVVNQFRKVRDEIQQKILTLHADIKEWQKIRG